MGICAGTLLGERPVLLVQALCAWKASVGGAWGVLGEESLIKVGMWVPWPLEGVRRLKAAWLKAPMCISSSLPESSCCEETSGVPRAA